MSTPGSILPVSASIRYLTGFCTAMRVARNLATGSLNLTHALVCYPSTSHLSRASKIIHKQRYFTHHWLDNPTFSSFTVDVVWGFCCLNYILLSFSTDGSWWLGGWCCRGDIAVAKRPRNSVSVVPRLKKKIYHRCHYTMTMNPAYKSFLEKNKNPKNIVAFTRVNNDRKFCWQQRFSEGVTLQKSSNLILVNHVTNFHFIFVVLKDNQSNNTLWMEL